MKIKGLFFLNKTELKKFLKLSSFYQIQNKFYNSFITTFKTKNILKCKQFKPRVINYDNNIKTHIYINKYSQANYSTFTKPNSSNILKEYKKKIDGSINIFEEIFPRELNSKDKFSNYFNTKSISENLTLDGDIPLDSLNNSIFLPCWDMVDRGGKRWRPVLGLILSDVFNVDLNNPSCCEKKKLFYQLLYMVESLHNASLILDDVEDKSESRRNLPCVHLKYGEAISINAGISFLFFPFYKIIQNIQDPILLSELSKSFFQELSAIHIGQGWDIEMNIKKRTPNVNNYKDTVLMKTGVFPRLIVKVLRDIIKQEICKKKNLEETEFIDYIFKRLLDIVDNMSISFQIKDDLLNITDSELAKGKGFFGEDIFEGKLTLMILHSLNMTSGTGEEEKRIEISKIRLREILDMHTKDSVLIREAVEILKDNKSIEFAEERMNYHVDKAISMCNELINDIKKHGFDKQFNIEAIESIKKMISYLIDRSI